MRSLEKLVAAILLLLLGPALAVAAQPGELAGRAPSAPARVLSPAEICSSIRRALESNGAPATALPSLAQIRPALPVTVTVDDPGLEVLRLAPDIVPGSVRVRLWTGKQPAIHPFDVRVLAAGDLLLWLDQRKESGNAALVLATNAAPAVETHLARPAAPKPPTLVFPGRAATLLLESSDMEVRTPVMPLNRGSSGEWIRVRNLSTGRILNAQVVGPGRLEMQF